MLSWFKEVLGHKKPKHNSHSHSSPASWFRDDDERLEHAEDGLNVLGREDFCRINNDYHVRHLRFPKPPSPTSPSAPPPSSHSPTRSPSSFTYVSDGQDLQLARWSQSPTPSSTQLTPLSSTPLETLVQPPSSGTSNAYTLSTSEAEMPLESQQSPTVPGKDFGLGKENQSKGTLQAAADGVLRLTDDQDSHPSCFLTTVLTSHIGQLFTEQDEKYVLVRVKGKVQKVSLNGCPCHVPPCRLVWRGGQTVSLVELPDSTFVEIDAVLCPESKELHAALIWQDTKPERCLQLLDNTYMFLDSRRVICWPRYENMVAKNLSVVFDGTIVSAEVCDAVVFIGEAKATLDELLQHDSSECNATVYKVLEGTGGGRVLYVCTCLWVGQMPPISSLPMLIKKQTLYSKESHGLYSKSERKTTLCLDVDASLCVSSGTATIQVEVDGLRRSLKATHPLGLELGCQKPGETTRVNVHVSKEKLGKKLVGFSAVMIKLSDSAGLDAILNKTSPWLYCPSDSNDTVRQVCENTSGGHNADDHLIKVSSSLNYSVPVAQNYSVPAAQKTTDIAAENPNAATQMTLNRAELTRDTTAKMTPDTVAQRTPERAVQMSLDADARKVLDTAAQMTPDTHVHKTPDTEAQMTRDAAAQRVPDTAAQKTPDTVAQRTSDTAAQKTPDTAAQKTPDTAAQKTPDTAAQKTPDTAAQKTPDTAAQKTPDTVAQKTPDTAAQKTPDTAAQKIPVTAAQKTPDTAAQKTPDTAAQKTPDTVAQKTPDTAAQKTPNAAAQKTPTTPAQKINNTAAQKIPNTPAQKTSGKAARTNTKSASLSQLSSTQQRWDYLTCSVVVASHTAAVVTGAGNKIFVSKAHLFVNEARLSRRASVALTAKKFPNLGVIYTQSQKVYQCQGHSVDLVAVAAWLGKKPSFINDIIEQRLAKLKKAAAPEVTQTPPTETKVLATCMIRRISQNSVTLGVRSKLLPNNSGMATARLCDIYENGTPMTQIKVKNVKVKEWYCQLQIDKDGKQLKVPLAWRGKKPVNEASSSSRVSQQPRQALSTGDLTSALSYPPGAVALVQQDDLQSLVSSPPKEMTGEVTEVLAEGGCLKGENGRRYPFSLEVCFLFGVCLHQIEPRQVLRVGMMVEFEVVKKSHSSSSEDFVQRVWVEGEDASLTFPPTSSMIDTWCSDNGIPWATHCVLKREAELLSPSLFPTAHKLEETTTIDITT